MNKKNESGLPDEGASAEEEIDNWLKAEDQIYDRLREAGAYDPETWVYLGHGDWEIKNRIIIPKQPGLTKNECLVTAANMLMEIGPEVARKWAKTSEGDPIFDWVYLNITIID